MSVQVSYKKQILLLFLFLLIILVFIESLARIYDFFNPKCNLMTNEVYKNENYFLKSQICDAWANRIWYMDPQTDLQSLEPNQHVYTLNINSHGFRGPEISQEKPDNVYRIFMMGGSTTFAIRAHSDSHTIPGYLHDFLNSKNLTKKIEVINAGIPRLTSSDEAQLVQKKLVEFNPDLIIIYDGVNDITLPYGFTKEKLSE